MRAYFGVFLFLFLHVFFATAWCQKKLSFETDFSGVTLNKEMTRLRGIDTLNIKLNFESKDRSKAWAEICNAPKMRNTQALHYQFVAPNVQSEDGTESKGRIQNELAFKPGFKSVMNEIDVYLPKDMALLKSYPKAVSFLTLQEYWNDTYNKVRDKVFRMTIEINKDKGIGKDFYFGLRCADLKQDTFHYTFKSKFKSWKVPFGQWFTLRTEITEGNVEKGNFKLMVKYPQERDWTVIFDGSIQTQSSEYNDGSLSPDGINSFQVLKFYTSKEIINFMKELGHTMDVYFTNWKFEGVKYE